MKKVFSILVVGALLLCVVGCAGLEMEVDGWTLNRREGRTTIIAAAESLVEDGVLFVPNRIGRHNIVGFGTPV